MNHAVEYELCKIGLFASRQYQISMNLSQGIGAILDLTQTKMRLWGIDLQCIQYVVLLSTLVLITEGIVHPTNTNYIVYLFTFMLFPIQYCYLFCVKNTFLKSLHWAYVHIVTVYNILSAKHIICFMYNLIHIKVNMASTLVHQGFFFFWSLKTFSYPRLKLAVNCWDIKLKVPHRGTLLWELCKWTLAKLFSKDKYDGLRHTVMLDYL